MSAFRTERSRATAAKGCRETCTRPAQWGWLPALSVIGALGLALVAVADTGWRTGAPWSATAFWAGLLVMFAPVAFRMAAPDISREERIGLVVALGLGLYGVKIFNSPLSFKGFDELLHLRTANDILVAERLFNQNPLLPVSALYPGMESIVSAIHQLCGLAAFPSGLIVIGAGRLLLVISLYLFYLNVTGSDRLAGVATLLYMANPNFVFFNALFAYESLALPLAVLFLLVLTRWLRTPRESPAGFVLAMLLAFGAVVITHHLTTYFLLAMLVLWAAVDAGARRWFRRDDHQARAPGMTLLGWAPALSALALTLAWLFYVGTLRVAAPPAAGTATDRRQTTSVTMERVGPDAPPPPEAETSTDRRLASPSTVDYIAPDVSSAVRELAGYILGRTPGRRLFTTELGTKAPVAEQLSGYAAAGLSVVLMAVGLLHLWRAHRRNVPLVTLGIGALCYPFSQAFRLVHIKVDIPGRTGQFLFVALALVLALAFCDCLLPALLRRAGWLRRQLVFAGAACCMGTIFIGGVAVGWKPLPPGPHLVGATTRSVDAQGVSAALWAREALGPGRRFAADRISGLLMVAYGQQYQVTKSEDWEQIPDVFFAAAVGPREIEILRAGRVSYLVVDRRQSRALPFLGFYFEQSEAGAFRHRQPIALDALDKFEDLDRVSLVFDGGDLRVYDVQALWNGS